MYLSFLIVPGVIALAASGVILLTDDKQKPASLATDTSSTVIGEAQEKTSPTKRSNRDVPEAPAANVLQREPETLIALAKDKKELKTLTEIIKVAGLSEILSAEGPYTIFAPNEKAFAKLPEGALAELTAAENIEDLQKLLGLHVVTGITTSDELQTDTTITTLADETLTISVNDTGMITVGDAAVIGTDLMATNGVIHIIDTVINESA